MKIGIDARLWSQTGIGRYIRNLVIQLQKIDKDNSYVLFVTKNDELEVRRNISNKNWKIVVANSVWHSLSEQISLPKIFEREKVDLMHFPYFSVPIFYNKPYVVTIHDLILHHFSTGKSSTLPLWLYGFKMLAYRFVINKTVRNAKKVIAVSNSTKDEIIDHLMVNKGNVEVIYEAADDFKNLANEKTEFKNYFLFVGNVYPHKNTDKLLKAFEKFSKNNDCNLIFIGKDDYFYKRLKKSTNKFKDRIVYLSDVDDSKLSSLYESAVCLIRPSLMEGFSLPPLEAMINRCLVLASDIPVHREILKDGAIYFNPNNWQEILDRMEFVFKIDQKTKEEYLRKGEKIAKEFSWENTARQTLKVYESSLGI